jgi:RHS repeat-associated protein
LGRLTTVVEDPASSKYATYYQYDPLDNLTSVRQAGTCNQADPVASPCSGGLSRTFTYSSLRRLLTASNPENGTVEYTYDVAGNLNRRKQGSAVVCFGTRQADDTCQHDGYDDLNRLLKKTYNDATLEVDYSYDTASSQVPAGCTADGAIGRLASVGNSISTSYYSYNKLGFTQCNRQLTGTIAYDFQYTTSPQGEWKTIVYPSGRTASISLNDRGLPTAVDSAIRSYATGVSYWPHGGLRQLVLGNLLKEQNCYNARLQLSAQRVGTADFNSACQNQASDLLAIGYDFGGSANNGNLHGQTISVPWKDSNGVQHTQTMSQSYGYDALNRLNSASETVTGLPTGVAAGYGSWAFGSDQYGNLWGTNTYGLSGLMPASADYFAPDTNRLAKYGANPPIDLPSDAYDAFGNLQHHQDLCQNGNSPCAQYDREGRMVGMTQGGNVVQYDYDGEGRRVRKTETGASPVTTIYVYDAKGDLAAEYNTQGGTPETGRRYLTVDHLASTRLLTDDNGAVVQRLDYFPFGQAIPGAPGLEAYGNRNASRVSGYNSTTSLTLQFTGKERDAETGLDYFGARYFSSAQGRWTSPDWSAVPQPVPYADLNDPQTLNLYGYVRNNPLSIRDFDGHGWWGDLWKGIADHTYRPLVQFVSHPIVTARNLGGVVTHPVATARAIKTGVVTTTINVFHGNGEAIGTAVGTIGMAFIPGAGEAGEGAEAAADLGKVAQLGETAETAAVGLGITGTKEAATIAERLAIEAAEANPAVGKVLQTTLKDSRWPSSQGWVKMESRSPGGVVVHWVRNTITGEAKDFKLK